MARKSLESFEKEDELKVFNVGGVELTEEQLKQLIEENKKLKSGKFVEDRTGKTHTKYEIVLSRFNNRFQHSKGIYFGVNGQMYFVEFGKPTINDKEIINTMNKHIVLNHQLDPRTGISEPVNVHYQYQIIREIWE